MKVTVNVTQEDIDSSHATQHDILNFNTWKIYSCPNAKALSRTLGKKCAFGTDSWWYKNSDGSYKASEEAKTFAYNFDVGNPVKPYSFEVEV